MRKTSRLFILLLTFSINWALGQTNLIVKKLKDENLVHVLNNLNLLTEHKTNELAICVFNVSNSSSSAKKSSSDEITNILYIAVSEFDELPNQSLFTYGPLYNPKFITWNDSNSQQNLIIEYGEFDSRKQVTLNISLDDIVIAK